MVMQCSSKTNGKENDCSIENQFQCGKRCISKHRLVDYNSDCPDNIDEKYNESYVLNHKHRSKCTSSITGTHITQCILSTNIWLGKRDDCRSKIQLLHFPTLCDGYTDYIEKINNVLETDETNCERWQCDN
ncbi:unnamed protein product [Rotaria sp. Silwood1]|nr:unnamed protein product [Rotaria sp. Silwood1]